ncbi:PaaX family transcriptional regulator C-terminal domain-containing protein [Nonomuraea sp. NPDC049684]|uniref:PaaX family transcriptional regulator C-terminal domain-containing protein n=1 Tax=Nonomuraea sp. NPDC049684 TaxID=3364356 RepID=UPI003789A6AC
MAAGRDRRTLRPARRGGGAPAPVPPGARRTVGPVRGVRAAEFTRAMEADPLLPPELLPRPWPGTRARSPAVGA